MIPTDPQQQDVDPREYLAHVIDSLHERRGALGKPCEEGRHLSLAITAVEDAVLRIGCANAEAGRAVPGITG